MCIRMATVINVMFKLELNGSVITLSIRKLIVFKSIESISLAHMIESIKSKKDLFEPLVP